MTSGKRVVWDCFFFNDELDLLEVRFRELDPVVDRFVVVEGDRTFAGVPKRSPFAEHRDRFEPWAEKTTHLVVALPVEADTAWEREEAQRRGLFELLASELADEDLVLLGDVDELVDRDVVPKLQVLREPVRLWMVNATYYANWSLPKVGWRTSTLAFHRRHLDATMVRAQLGRAISIDGYVEQRLLETGTHLSYVGGPALIRSKWQSYSFRHYATPRYTSGQFLERCMTHGVTYDGRWILDRAQPGTWSAQLHRLAADPVGRSLLNREPASGAWKTDTFAGYAWLRARGLVPSALWPLFDRRPGLLGIASPLLVALTRVLRRRRGDGGTAPPWPWVERTIGELGSDVRCDDD